MENFLIPTIILAAFLLVVAYRELQSRFFNMEKKVIDYFTHEGFEWKKEDGVLNVKRSGVNFRVFLKGEDNLKSTSLWIQYATQLEEDLNKMHWAGQTVMVNVLNDRHPSLNVSMNTEDHVLWVHYRADIRSQKEFAYHFNGAYSEMQSLMKDYSDILPKLQADFPSEKKEHKPIGFS